jgi:hypothetical protein
MMNIFGQDTPPTVSSMTIKPVIPALDIKTKTNLWITELLLSSLPSGNYKNSCPSIGPPNSNNPKYTSPACQDRYNNQYGLHSKERPQPEKSRPRPHNPRGNRNPISNTQYSLGFTPTTPPTNGFLAFSEPKSGEKVRNSSGEKLSPPPISPPSSFPQLARLPASPLHPPALLSIVAGPVGAPALPAALLSIVAGPVGAPALPAALLSIVAGTVGAPALPAALLSIVAGPVVAPALPAGAQVRPEPILSILMIEQQS